MPYSPQIKQYNEQYKTFFVENFKNRQERLSAEEIRVLDALNIGYGNFVNNAAKVGLHVNTYRYIIRRGHGRRENVTKIRSLFLTNPGNESHLSEPAQNR